MAELAFFSGTMDCGKSTLALQMDHNHAARGRGGVIFTRNDRAGVDVLSSRLGLRVGACEVHDDTDFWEEVVRRRTRGDRVDYLICDEAQFYSPVQVEQLARIVDEMAVDVYAFGITSDFRTRLFPGSARLVELADRVVQTAVGHAKLSPELLAQLLIASRGTELGAQIVAQALAGRRTRGMPLRLGAHGRNLLLQR